MNTLRSFLLALPLCLLSLACTAIQRPTASFKSMFVGDVTAQGLTMKFNLDLANPNAMALPLSDADYRLALGGVQVLEGKATPAGSIPANGTLPVVLPVTLTYENLLAAQDAIRKGGGDVPYTLDGGLSVGGGNALLGQSVRVPLQFTGTLPLKQVLNDPRLLLQSAAARKLAEQALGGFLGR